MLPLLAILLLAQAEPFPYPPDQEQLGKDGYAQLTSGHAAEAEATLRTLTDHLAPENPRGWRLLGFALLQQGRHADAIRAFDKAEKLHVDKARLPSLLAARAQAKWSTKDLFGARADVDRALLLDDKDAQALLLSSVMHGMSGDLLAAQGEALRAVAVEPKEPQKRLWLARVYLARELPDEARAQLAEARALNGDPALLAELEGDLRSLSRQALYWQVPLALVALMAAGVLLLFLAGSALSRVEMKSLNDLQRSAASLQGEATAGEQLVHRLYLGVLWFGTVFFYLSVPAMVVVSLATGLGLCWLMFTKLDRIPIKLVFILLVVAVGGTWAVLRSLFLKLGEKDSGLLVDAAREPALFEALREVSEVAGTRMVDKVYLELGAEAAVRESGGALQVLSGRGLRVLHLGFWTLSSLDTSELKAILAHEYGHFSHGETRLTPVIGRIQATMFQMLVRMAALGRSTWANPVYWYLRFYLRAFVATTSSHSRRKELLADRAAALAYGGDAFGRALGKVVRADLVFGRYAGLLAGLLRESGRPIDELYRSVSAAEASEPPGLHDERLRAVMDRKAETFDSHPPPSDRIARVAGVAGQRSGDGKPSLSLLANAEAVARTLAEKIRGNVDEQLAARGALPAAAALAPGAQLCFAQGVALHAAANELAERKDPLSDGLYLRAAEQLRAALGEQDALLVPALASAARVHEKDGRVADARLAAEQGLKILSAHPDQPMQKQLEGLLSRLGKAA